MKNWTVIAFVVVIVILGGLFIVAGPTSFAPKKTATTPSNVLVTQEETLGAVSATLSLIPTYASAQVGQESMYSMQLQSSTQVVGVESHLTFDPSKVEIVSITPGALFSQPEILNNIVDKNVGKIDYALGSFTPVAANGEVAQIVVKPLVPFSGNLLMFNKSTTKVALFDAVGPRPYGESEITVDFIEQPISVSN